MGGTRKRNEDWATETLAVHAGEYVDPATRASSPNLVMSVTFAPEHLTGFSARDEQGYEGFVYGRVSSPTVKQLEDKLAALEGESRPCALPQVSPRPMR